jgi:glycosyltransferase involved in cell wall biosynthesis
MPRLKILYISSPHFFDMDLSLIRSLSGKCDLHFLIDVSPNTRNYTALSLNSPKAEAGIYPATDFEELDIWDEFIDRKKSDILYRDSGKSYAPSNLRLQFALKQYIDKLNPDLIHCSSLLNIRHFYFLLRNKRKIMITLHDPFPHTGETSFKVSQKRRLNYHFVKNVLLLNRSQVRAFIESGHQDKKVSISSLGIYEYLGKYKTQSQPDNKFRVLFFGRISPYKGLEYLMESFAGLIQSGHKDMELVIAGGGKYWFDTTPYASMPEIKILNRYIPNEELVQLLQDASVVICPYTDATQSGVIMSAYALKKPVIATRVGGLAEMVEDRETGLLIDPKSTAAITNAILELKNDPALLAAMEDNIDRQFFEGERSWDAITNNLMTIYQLL